MPKSPQSPKADTEDSPPPRKRRWPRRLLIFLLVLVALAIFLNGPGGRWIVKSVLISQLEKQGLTGDLDLGGRLHSGYELTNASFTGTGPIRTLTFDALAIQYRLPKLLDQQIDALSGRNINVVLHPDPAPEDEPDEPDEPFTLDIPEDTIQLIRGFVLPVALDFHNVSVEIQRDNTPPVGVQFGGLSHRSGDDAIRLTGLSSNALGGKGLPSQDIEIDWTADGVALSGVQILPSFQVEALQVGLQPGLPATITGDLKLAGATLALKADETGSATLTLQDTSLSLKDLIEELPMNFELAGSLDTLIVDVDNMLAPPQEWRGKLELLATDLRYGNFQIDTFEASGTITPEGVALVTSVGRDQTTELKIHTPLPSAGVDKLLADHPFDFNLELGSIDDSLAWILAGLSEDPSKSPPVLPSGSFSLSGRVVLDADGKPSMVAANFHTQELVYQDKPIPPLKGSAKLTDQLAQAVLGLAKPAEGESIELSASARLDAGTYEARTGITLPDPSWVNALIPGDSPLWRPSGPVSISWEGSGSYKKMTHKGSATVAELKITTPEETLTSINTKLSYGWPGSVTLESLDVRNGDLTISGALDWKDGILNIPGIEAADQSGVLMKLSGSAPLAESLRSLQDLLAADQEFDLAFDADRFELSRLAPLLPVKIPEGYAAGFQSNLRLTGTAAHPKLDGQLQILDIQVPQPEGLPPEKAVIDFATSNDTLTLHGTISDADGEIIEIDAEAPLKIRDWAADPKTLRDATFRSHAVAQAFDFTRLQRFLPEKMSIAKGSIGIDVVAEGPVSKPNLTGNIAVSVDRLSLTNSPYRQIDSVQLLLRFEGQRFFLDPSPIVIAGGKVILTGDANIEGEEPRFNVQIDADHALLWRDDGYSARANGKLTLVGTPKAAKLAGSVDIVESLVYKDIEIIPIGVPTTSVPKPSLPKIDKKSSGGPLVPAPAPISDWTLDVKVRTLDPILIRGNLATGEVHVNAAVGGTVSSPEPTGTIELRDVSADLPFSTLKVKKGQIVLRPKAPLNPTLDIRGTSSINKRQVAMLVFGPLNNPKYTLSSDPPLPENEILTLIATGSTTKDLEDTNTASMKAFQLMIEELRRRSSKPGGNAAFKKVLQELKDVEFNVGENDPFTGRKFSSATLQLADKYYLSAGFDNEGNTRTSIIYSLRFR